MAYVATEDIYIGAGACAHRKGDVVPDENVQAHGWYDKVSGSPEADEQAVSDTV